MEEFTINEEGRVVSVKEVGECRKCKKAKKDNTSVKVNQNLAKGKERVQNE